MIKKVFGFSLFTAIAIIVTLGASAGFTADADIAGPKQILSEILPYHLKNGDCVGWIAIPGTVINYPVMYAPERYVEDMESKAEYYLYRDFEQKNDVRGSIFIGAHNWIEPQDFNVYFWGHNMKDKSMFAALHDYGIKNQNLEKAVEYYNAHRIIQFTSLFEKQEYEIIAAFRTMTDDKQEFKYWTYFNPSNENEFNEYIANIMRLSYYDTGVEAKFGDRLITLSTCFTGTSDKMVVVGVMRR